MIAIICFTLSIVAYGISQLVQHGQFRWMSKDRFGFWGEDSDKRKYKKGTKEPAFFLSTTVLTFLTDGYHLAQKLFFLFLSLGIYLTGINIFDYWLWDFLTVWGGVLFVHWLTRRLLSK